MRILIIQLARFGDILITAPVISALSRKYPEAQIDLVVRSKYAETAHLLERSVNRIIEFDTASVLKPILIEADLDQSLENLSEIVEELSSHKIDVLVNLTYSPVSSYLTYLLQDSATTVIGYSRMSDGHLQICDDTSAYFYAQVGPGLSNRFHLTDIFASALEVDLTEQDWNLFPQVERSEAIVIHIGASHPDKTLSMGQWKAIIARLLATQDIDIQIIGSSEESERADLAFSEINSPRVHNLVGKTSFFEVVGLISKCRLLIGGDSSPMHIASLTGTPALNLSFSKVNFWETGPRSTGSRILFSIEPSELSALAVSREIDLMLNSPTTMDASKAIAEYSGLHNPCYRLLKGDHIRSFEWQLISSLYAQTAVPMLPSERIQKAFHQLREINDMLIGHLLQMLEGKDPKRHTEYVSLCEELMRTLAVEETAVSPLIKWSSTQKSRVKPGELEAVLTEYLAIHEQLNGYLNILFENTSTKEIEL